MAATEATPQVIWFDGTLDVERARIMMELVAEAAPSAVVLDLTRATDVHDAAVAYLGMTAERHHPRAEVRGLRDRQQRLLHLLTTGSFPDRPRPWAAVEGED